MVENAWTMLPLPYMELATPKPLRSLDASCFVERMLEDGVELAGGLAASAEHPEVDERDILYALRLLSEHMHSLMAIWREWREIEEPEEAEEG